MSRNRDSLCIVMEFCDGGDLSDIIKKVRKERGENKEEYSLT